MKFKRKKVEKFLGEILVDRGVITLEQLGNVLEVQKKEGGLTGEIIVRLGFAREEDIAQCISFQYGVPYLPLENYDIPLDVIKLIPRKVASHYCAIPIDKIGDTLTVAMANPLNERAIDDIEDITSLEIQVFVSTVSDIRRAIDKFYGKDE